LDNLMDAKATRRQFLGAAAGFTILSSARLVRGCEANERLNLAVFGGMYNAQHMLSAPHLYKAPIVALCDPDQRKITENLQRWEETAARLESAPRAEEREWADRYRRMARGEGVKLYSDIRRMFDEMAGSIDALVVSHYDHLHGVACSPALRAGIPVCSERPLGLNISEARKLRALAAETKLPTTYRSPGTGTGQFRRAMELVEDGVLGPVREVHIWFRRGGPDRDMLPTGGQPVPAELNWDAWLGPLPWREHHSDWMANSHWRETSSGGLGVFGAHTTIFPFMTLQLRRLWDLPEGEATIRITAECSRRNEISFPRWERIRWEVPARGELPPVTLTWHHGPEYAPGARETIHQKLNDFGVTAAEEADALMKTAGSLVIGEKGALLADDHSVNVTALPRATFSDLELNRPLRISAGQGIYRDWIEACRGNASPIIASFDNGGPLSELLMLGNVATLFPEETLVYDPAEGRITNKPEANEHLAFDYRKGWTL
jgi:predicted dehydrogenase